MRKEVRVDEKETNITILKRYLRLSIYEAHAGLFLWFVGYVLSVKT